MASDDVTLYHGTPISRALEINRMGKISPAADSMIDVTDELKTTPGFVYLTTNPGVAAYYGNMLAYQHEETMFCIYKIVISRTVLETDYDELVMRYGFARGAEINLDDSVRLTQCCRTPVDLFLGREIRHHIILPSRYLFGRDPAVSKLLNSKRADALELAIDVARELPWQATSEISDK